MHYDQYKQVALTAPSNACYAGPYSFLSLQTKSKTNKNTT